MGGIVRLGGGGGGGGHCSSSICGGGAGSSASSSSDAGSSSDASSSSSLLETLSCGTDSARVAGAMACRIRAAAAGGRVRKPGGPG